MSPLRRAIEGLLTTRHSHLYRSSYALMITTAINAVFGLLFWIAAARIYPQRVVGLGAGGISALQLVAVPGWVGLQFTLLRYVPLAGVNRRRLVLAIYAAGIGIGLAVAVVFTSAFADELSVDYVSADPWSRIAFWACVAVWLAFTLQDAVLTSLRRAGVVPWENALYGVLKLILLVVLSSIAEPWTFLGVWVGGTVVFVAVLSVLLFHRWLPEAREPDVTPPAGTIARFSAGHSTVAIVVMAPDFLVPLLVLDYLGSEAGAQYFIAWTVGISARLLASNIANAVTVEAAYGQESLAVLMRRVLRLCVGVLGPVVLVMTAGAGYLLRVFGKDYADAGAGLLRLVVISLIPFTVVTLVVALDRVRERFAAALLITSIGTTTVIVADIFLIPAHGIVGAGIGWLAGQSLAAIVAVLMLVRQGALRGFEPHRHAVIEQET